MSERPLLRLTEPCGYLMNWVLFVFIYNELDNKMLVTETKSYSHCKNIPLRTGIPVVDHALEDFGEAQGER